ITHSIKRWVKLGYDIKSEEDIENVIKNLSEMHVAHLEQNRDLDNTMYDCTLSGILTWHEFTWPETENNTRYIYYVFEKPSPSSTTHTQPVKTWTIFHTSTQ
ncbi:26706_t:CDS:2, partial [Gigaspora margarita]